MEFRSRSEEMFDALLLLSLPEVEWCFLAGLDGFDLGCVLWPIVTHLVKEIIQFSNLSIQPWLL